MKKFYGVLVVEVFKGFFVDKLGFKVGDVIVLVNKKEIDSVWMLSKVIV